MNNNNKKGLSTIVATLLIILLTLVAVSIIWVVVRNVVQSGSEQVDMNSKCLQANVVVEGVSNTTEESFDVTLTREGGTEEIGGVKLIFMNDSEDSNFIANRPGNIAAFATVTQNVTIATEELANPSKVNVVVYFLSESGDEYPCSSGNELEF